LIAHKHPDIVEVIKAILEHEGFRIRTARDGEHAFKLLRKRSFDAVIFGEDMEKASGTKLLQIMRRSDKLKKIPAMLVADSQEEARRLQQNGSSKLANDCLVKPFNTRDLVGRIRVLLNSDLRKSQELSPPKRPSHPGL
jgi:two-component system response regulator (stage 0 sporulation protein A)